MNNTQMCSIITFNCKSIKRSAGNVRQLCKTADIIALQETWLLPNDIPFLGTIHDDFDYFGKSAVDTTQQLMRGRPYGGVALLWRRNRFRSVTVLTCASARLSAVKFEVDNKSFVVFSVYMPTQCSDNLPEFSDCLSEISAVIDSAGVETVFILGDYNSHPSEMFYNELTCFCDDQQWVCADVEKLGIGSGAYTFISDAHGSRRWLDHCVVTQSAWDTVMDIKVCYDVVWSDHFPVLMECNLKMVRLKSISEGRKCIIDKVKWGERTKPQIDLYYELCNNELKDIDFPTQVSLCADKLCCDITHRDIICKMYDKIVNILKESAILSYENGKNNQSKQKRNSRSITGWNKHVSAAHREARYKLQVWFWYGRPTSGIFYDEMCESRKIFKAKLKWCMKHQDQIKMDIIASYRSSKNFAQFWKSTNKLNLKPGLPVSIAGKTEARDIANLFKDNFQVESPLDTCTGRVLGAETVQNGTTCSVRVTAREVRDILQSMSRGKSPGHDGLSIEHLQYAGSHLPRVLAMFLSLCISHSYLPYNLMKTVVVPIIKNRTGDIADKNNYRPISLATIVAKVLDRLMDKHLDKHVNLHDGQFGFRKGLSTESAILALKHTVRYYVDRRTPVYACFLDLSRAFDMVAYDVLWQKLRNTTLPKELGSVFKYWYDNQVNYVKWAGELSDAYGLKCGVRQGGITSPKLFNLYVNELIGGLSSMQVGCSIDGTFVNNLSYADDMVLLAPSVSALRKLLSFCESYALTHGLRYNVNKSEYMLFTRGSLGPVTVPPVMLNGVTLKRISQFKYLGHLVSADLKDDADIDRERRALTVRANMLVRRFASCSKQVKITLFKAYCQNFYCSSLWTAYSQKALGALRVQYNNAFRMLLRLPRFCSASGMFVEARTDGFAAILRKKVASFLRGVRASGNGILAVIADKLDCPILKHQIRVLTK